MTQCMCCLFTVLMLDLFVAYEHGVVLIHSRFIMHYTYVSMRCTIMAGTRIEMAVAQCCNGGSPISQWQGPV